MINSVSFAAKHGIYDKVNVDAPQSHQRQQTTYVNNPPKAEKKGSVAKKLFGTLVVAAAVAAALAVGAKKGAFDPAKIADLTKSFKDSKWVSWAKEPAKTVLKYAQTAGDFIAENAKKVWDFGKNLIPAKKIAEEVTEGVGKA